MPFPTTPTNPKTRLIVLTDISSLTAGVREPDDGQSLIRLMLYRNAGGRCPAWAEGALSPS